MKQKQIPASVFFMDEFLPWQHAAELPEIGYSMKG
jgi:hypothetical protein